MLDGVITPHSRPGWSRALHANAGAGSLEG